MAGTKTWADGDVVTAADLNGFVRDQWITICTAGTRPSTSQEGRTIFETDTDRYLRWDGAAWQLVKCLGAWDTWAPTVTQSTTPTQTVTDGRVIKEGRRVSGKALFSFTTNGTASSPLQIVLPYAVPAAPQPVGTWMYIAPGVMIYSGIIVATAASTALFHTGVNVDWFGASPARTITNGDSLHITIDYLAAA